ncbi:MAG: hypothetical protein R3C15_09325 [Thermoleophilia bacterium]
MRPPRRRPRRPVETGAAPAPATDPAATATDPEPEAAPSAHVTVSIAGFPVTATGTVRDTAATRDEVVEHLRSTFPACRA